MVPVRSDRVVGSWGRSKYGVMRRGCGMSVVNLEVLLLVFCEISVKFLGLRFS